MSTAPQLEEPVEPVDEPVDGRTARAVRTRDGLVDATIALVEEGDLRPTAPRIAERAGVSVRSVFQHFDDLDSLFAAMGARVVERLAKLIGPIDPTAPQAERVAEFVRQRCLVSEAVTPINRAAILQAPGSSTIGRQFASGHGFVRAVTEEVFEAELEAAGPRRQQLLDGLIVAGSWPTWNLLRTLEHRSVEEATAAVAGMVDLLVWGAGR
ncbi:TetR/AcrR family transcriptional regulator [Aquihabitans sp. G128]|uniref:TetR/AcrR family transcriptional regulator n=1 Tax=Aquihabitans sp. G128 TaxID=2849779 RepID=UPI001C24CFCB|nr:TetR/AcrR family transcriptional regulator [Aquihabitans sp. G128]QXC61483.1 TetR/AcrR family transcriptional regulator [Aquihabitans sp. G128]